MNIPKLHIEFVDNLLSKNKFVADINIIPHATIIYLSLTQEVGINEMARNILEISEDEKINAIKWLKANNHLLNIKKEDLISTTQDHIISVTLLSGRKINVIYRLTVTKDDVLGPIFFITFQKGSKKASIDSIFNLYMLKDDINKLKGNLDAKGKDKLNDICKHYFNQDNKQLSLEDLVNYEKELQLIQKAFPLLSRREVLLCGLLVNEMELNDIASVTNRSLNSVFVTVHRINKKLEISNKNELIEILQKTVANENNDIEI